MKNKIILIIIFSVISLVPISNYSLWIDESTTAFFASQTRFEDLNQELFKARTSEVQMPGYIYYMWVWEKIFGHKEFMLRLSNIPFIIILLILIAFAPLSDRMKILLGFFISLSPFLWYNLNEARSTIPVFALGGTSIISLIYYFSGNRSLQKKGVWILTLSLIAGVSLNMLFLLFIPSIALLFLISSINNKYNFRTLIKDWWLGVSVMAVMIGALLVYYLWTLSLGAGGVKEAPSLSNTAFVLYEFLGFSGVGPPRSLLRESRSIELLKPFIPLMVLYLSAYILMFSFIVGRLWRENKTRQIILNPYLITFIFGILIFTFICSLSQFRFWGRHASFLYPLMIFYFAQMIDNSWSTKSLKFRLILPIIPLFLLTFISDFNIRFVADYQKENNKEAALKAIALTDKHGIIIWNSHDYLAAYYGLRVINYPQKMPEAWMLKRNAVIPPYTEGLADYLKKYRDQNSILVFFNRPDFDREGYYNDYVKDNGLSILFREKDYTIYSMNSSFK